MYCKYQPVCSYLGLSYYLTVLMFFIANISSHLACHHVLWSSLIGVEAVRLQLVLTVGIARYNVGAVTIVAKFMKKSCPSKSKNKQVCFPSSDVCKSLAPQSGTLC